ncbi:hypothetical protein ERJ75_000517800 [Trypanosoma vivax]|nr:hypothetical protein ERJ75_000517800 [Trypanosoma vivax]
MERWSDMAYEYLPVRLLFDTAAKQQRSTARWTCGAVECRETVFDQAGKAGPNSVSYWRHGNSTRSTALQCRRELGQCSEASQNLKQ